jgi:hypothetical protein
MRLWLPFAFLLLQSCAGAISWPRQLSTARLRRRYIVEPSHVLFKRSGMKKCKPRTSSADGQAAYRKPTQSASTASRSPASYGEDSQAITTTTNVPSKLTGQAATTSQTQQSAPPPTTPGSKKGIVYTDVKLVQPFGSAVTWGYDYAVARGQLPSSIEYVPMCHDAGSVDGFSAVATAAIQAGAKFLMGFVGAFASLKTS